MATNKKDSPEAIKRRKEKYKQEQDELYLIMCKLEAILNYFKLIYIEELTYNRSISGFKMLYGDSLIEKVFDDDKNKLISLNSTNYMLVQDLQIYISKIIDGGRSINGYYGDLDWINEIVSKITADEKAIETIARFLPYDLYDKVLKKCDRLPMSKERILQKRINEINKIMKIEENS